MRARFRMFLATADVLLSSILSWTDLVRLYVLSAVFLSWCEMRHASFHQGMGLGRGVADVFGMDCSAASIIILVNDWTMLSMGRFFRWSKFLSAR